MFSTLSCPKRSGLYAVLFTALLTQSPLMAARQSFGSFPKDETLKAWTSVNDGVMGGVSKGGFTISEEETLLFRGELSLENNGGFASIRTKQAELDLSGASALVVKARGDGRTYWIDLRAKDQMSASSYRGYLTTKSGEWTEVTVPLADFKLQAFGRDLPAKPLAADALVAVGFTLADKKAGPFQLEIGSIKTTAGGKTTAVGTPAPEAASGKTIVGVAKAAGSFKTLLAAATAADLAGVLDGDGPFTVFAPTDEAFAKLPAGTVETLLKPANRDQLTAILKYHVIAGPVALGKALELGEGTTLQGSKVAIRFEEGRVKVGDATLLKADLPASNGVIHVIDQVLIPAKTETKPLNAAGLIELAIEKGVPLFNSGEVDGCAAVYEVACEAVASQPGLPEAVRKDVTEALQDARAEKSTTSRAWILRRAMDRTWTKLNAESASGPAK
jgi:uncharacterized surface protein with fasciclin (FAS1) repeats